MQNPVGPTSISDLSEITLWFKHIYICTPYGVGTVVMRVRMHNTPYAYVVTWPVLQIDYCLAAFPAVQSTVQFESIGSGDPNLKFSKI